MQSPQRSPIRIERVNPAPTFSLDASPRTKAQSRANSGGTRGSPRSASPIYPSVGTYHSTYAPQRSKAALLQDRKELVKRRVQKAAKLIKQEFRVLGIRKADDLPFHGYQHGELDPRQVRGFVEEKLNLKRQERTRTEPLDSRLLSPSARSGHSQVHVHARANPGHNGDGHYGFDDGYADDDDGDDGHEYHGDSRDGLLGFEPVAPLQFNQVLEIQKQQHDDIQEIKSAIENMAWSLEAKLMAAARVASEQQPAIPRKKPDSGRSGTSKPVGHSAATEAANPPPLVGHAAIQTSDQPLLDELQQVPSREADLLSSADSAIPPHGHEDPATAREAEAKVAATARNRPLKPSLRPDPRSHSKQPSSRPNPPLRPKPASQEQQTLSRPSLPGRPDFAVTLPKPEARKTRTGLFFAKRNMDEENERRLEESDRRLARSFKKIMAETQLEEQKKTKKKVTWRRPPPVRTSAPVARPKTKASRSSEPQPHEPGIEHRKPAVEPGRSEQRSRSASPGSSRLKEAWVELELSRLRQSIAENCREQQSIIEEQQRHRDLENRRRTEEMIHESLQTLRHSTPPPPPPPRSESRTPIFWEFNPRDHTGDGAAGGWDAPHESRLDLGATTKSWPTRDAGGDSQDRDAAPVQANFEDMSDAIIMRKLHPVLEKAQSEFQKAARRMEETLDRLDRQHGSKGGLERGESKDSLDRLLGESVIKVETYHEPTLESSKPKPSKPAAVHLPLKTGNDFLADVDNVDSDNFVLKYILTKLQSIEDEGKELRKHIAVAHSGRESPSHAAKSDDARCSSSPPQLPIASSAPAASAADTQSSPSMHPENPIKSCDSGSRAPEPHFREPSDEIVIEKHSRNPAPRIPVADDFTKLARRYNARAQIELPPELVQRIEQGRSKYQRYLNNSMGPASVGYDDDTEWSMTPWKALDRMSAEFLDVVLSDVAAELSKVTDDFVDRMMKEEFSPLQATADRA